MIFYEYKIYEVGGKVDYTIYGESKPRTLVDFGHTMVDNHDMFREHIKLTYGDSIKFARNKKMVDGDLYCTVINKRSNERNNDLLTLYRVECDYCGTSIMYHEYEKYRVGKLNFKHWKLKDNQNYNYCNSDCCNKHFELLNNKNIEKNDGVDVTKWIDRDNSKYDGYIYMITKKSSGEFYIGQTNSLPIFRWAQHLDTKRFPLDEIEDYKFEILEVVKDKSQLNKIELNYIKDYAMKYPRLILNKNGITKEMKENYNLFEISEKEEN